MNLFRGHVDATFEDFGERRLDVDDAAFVAPEDVVEALVRRGGRDRHGFGFVLATAVNAKNRGFPESPESPLVVRHHQNWRQKAQDLMLKKDKRDFYFTAPLTISARDFETFAQRLVEIIGELQRTVEKTKPEEVACINIDFFRVT